MKTLPFTIALLLANTWLAAGAGAEVYRWVDKNGKIHYSDKKPPDSNVENISSQVEKSNIDESSRETRKLGKIFAPESAAEIRLRQQQQAQQEARRQQHEDKCKQARERLSKLKGRIYFIDKNGKAYNISEKERKRREEAMEDFIRQQCS